MESRNLFPQTYSGYYKHEVDVNLIGAELMFELMGYRHTALGELILEGPIDPDKVSNVSRDAIVAFVECQVIPIVNCTKVKWNNNSISYQCVDISVYLNINQLLLFADTKTDLGECISKFYHFMARSVGI